MLIIGELDGNRLYFVLGPCGLNVRWGRRLWDGFEANPRGKEQGMCNIEVVDPLCLVAANVNYPKSRDKFHSFPSSSQPMNVRLTILSCSASGQWGNSAMLRKFADQHFADVLHTIHLYCERVSCIWFIIRLWVTVLFFNLLHTCGLQTRPYSIHGLCV